MDMLAELSLAGCSVSPFIAGKQTPFADLPSGDIGLTLDCIARMRLRSPQWLIPSVSAMQLVSGDRYVNAFNAGANLATINLTPPVAQARYPIYKTDRFIMDESRVLAAIAAAGCEPSRVGIAEHLRTHKGLATEPVPSSSETASRAFEAVRSVTYP